MQLITSVKLGEILYLMVCFNISSHHIKLSLSLSHDWVIVALFFCRMYKSFPVIRKGIISYLKFSDNFIYTLEVHHPFLLPLYACYTYCPLFDLFLTTFF